jgi:hypothetical protein
MARSEPKHAEKNSRASRAWFLGGIVIATMGIMIGALAAIPDSSGVIHGCYAPNNGYRLRVVDSEAGKKCPSGTVPLNWNQTGPPGPPASLPPGTVTGAHMFTGTLDPNSYPGAGSHVVTCPDGVAVAGSAFIGGVGVGGREASIPALIADTGTFRASVELDWSLYYDQLTAGSRVSWLVTYATVSS